MVWEVNGLWLDWIGICWITWVGGGSAITLLEANLTWELKVAGFWLSWLKPYVAKFWEGVLTRLKEVVGLSTVMQ